MKSPYSLEALIEAFDTLYDAEPSYDVYEAMMDSKKAANSLWESLDEESRKEIKEYLS